MIDECIICDKSVLESDIFLLNGEVVHKSCVEALGMTYTNLDNTIKGCRDQNNLLGYEFNKLNSLSGKTVRIFSSKSKRELINLEIELSENSVLLNRLTDRKEKILRNRKEVLSRIYDYWPERPPDWETRRQLLLIKQGFCSFCGSSQTPLHLHHKHHISNGGNHTPDNLVVLCKKFHSKQHGGRNLFKCSNFEKRETAFARRHRVLREAAKNHKMVKFNYRKYGGEKSKRVIYPESFEKVGKSLCVRGFCTLRNGERVFSIRRISNLQIVK